MLSIQHLTGTLVVGAQLEAGHAILVHPAGDCVLFEKFLGGQTQPQLQRQDVIGGQGDIGPLATGVETGNSPIASELEAGIAGEQMGQVGALEGEVEVLVAHGVRSLLA